MWKNTYKDYKPDDPWNRNPLESGNGICGCEMNELNGWGNTLHQPQPSKRGLLRRLLNFFFRGL